MFITNFGAFTDLEKGYDPGSAQCLVKRPNFVRAAKGVGYGEQGVRFI